MVQTCIVKGSGGKGPDSASLGASQQEKDTRGGPQHREILQPGPIGRRVQPDATEFFVPFVHIPGRYEWCRIRSPTHGVFDCFIVLGESTHVPCTVYVGNDAGLRFMRDRYPESTCILADIQLDDQLHTVACALRAAEGPIHAAKMVFEADPGVPREVPYGGDSVWGSAFACQGVDLELDARVTGHVRGPEVDTAVEGAGILTLGSYGTLTRS